MPAVKKPIRVTRSSLKRKEKKRTKAKVGRTIYFWSLTAADNGLPRKPLSYVPTSASFHRNHDNNEKPRYSTSISPPSQVEQKLTLVIIFINIRLIHIRSPSIQLIPGLLTRNFPQMLNCLTGSFVALMYLSVRRVPIPRHYSCHVDDGCAPGGVGSGTRQGGVNGLGSRWWSLRVVEWRSLQQPHTRRIPLSSNQCVRKLRATLVGRKRGRRNETWDERKGVRRDPVGKQASTSANGFLPAQETTRQAFIPTPKAIFKHHIHHTA